MEDFKLDKTDISILEILLENAKTPYKIISQTLDISLGTVHVRIKRLESLNIINGYHIDLNFDMLGYSILVFVGIIIDSSKYDKVVSEFKKINELVELHNTTGKFHMLGKFYCKNTTHLRDVLIEKISSIDGVVKTETTMSLMPIISKPGITLK